MPKSTSAKVILVPVKKLKHIEGFSKTRAMWLRKKIIKEGVWNKPVALDEKHGLVMDGQHRMEVALALGLKKIPAVKYRYADVEIWSLRPKRYQFNWKQVVERALSGDIYPYKTVKHRFPSPLPEVSFSLDELM